MSKFQTPYATRLIQGLTQKTGHILQHATKDEVLKAACSEIAGLPLADLSTVEVPSNSSSILYITVEQGY